MVLLSATASILPAARLIVATFDHGTGSAATAAVALVQETSRRLNIRSVAGRTRHTLRSEAELRDERWAFLHGVASDSEAAICTGHTRDDQVETLVMRTLRGSGPRGLAALYAPSDIARPLIDIARAEVAHYAAGEGVVWIEDPTNATPRYFRNRVRHDLLPALRSVRPSIDDDLLAIARRAAELRADVESIVDQVPGLRILGAGRGMNVDASVFASSDAASLFWPAIAAKSGVVLDRRGLARLVAFTGNARVGARIQLAGGWQVVRSRTDFELRRSGDLAPTVVSLQLSEVTSFGEWSFKPSAENDGSPWIATLPVDREVTVRPWRSGDTMTVRVGGRAKKVKRLLSEAGVTGHNRAGWPVVLAGDQIVWIPGVCRASATVALSGAAVERGLPFLCEYIHR